MELSWVTRHSNTGGPKSRPQHLVTMALNSLQSKNKLKHRGGKLTEGFRRNTYNCQTKKYTKAKAMESSHGTQERQEQRQGTLQ